MTGLTSVDAIVTSFLEAKTDPGESFSEEGRLPRPFSEGGGASQERLFTRVASSQSTQMPEVHQLCRAKLVTAAGKPTSSSSSLAFLPGKANSCPSVSGSRYLAENSKSTTMVKYLKKDSDVITEYLGKDSDVITEYLEKESGKITEYLGKDSKPGTTITDEESSSSPSSPFLSAPSSRLFNIFF